MKARVVQRSARIPSRCALQDEEGELLIIDFDEGALPVGTIIRGNLRAEGWASFTTEETGERVTGSLESVGGTLEQTLQHLR